MSNDHLPEGYHSVTPYLIVPDVPGLLPFLHDAFDGVETERVQRPDGSIVHAECRIGDSIVMIGAASQEYPSRPATLYLYVADADRVYARAIDAGADSIAEPADQFYGDRAGGVRDRWENAWWIATPMRTMDKSTPNRNTAG